jgi:catechol 2,3-dioxygenase-like lactoylglutathione lyase family enzyme
VTDVAAHTTFFTGVLGGTPVTVAGQQIVKLTNVLVFLRRQPPTGGTKGSAVDHIGFSVPNLGAVLDRVKAGGYRVVSSGAASAVVMAPDNLQVELVEVKTQQTPSALHHVHFSSPQNTQMRTWYSTVLGIKLRPDETPTTTPTLALPGVQLDFSRAAGEVAHTSGRVIDHIGFEVEHLEDFLHRLEDIGVRLWGLQRLPDLGASTAFVVDPWGTSVQFTEGFDTIK